MLYSKDNQKIPKKTAEKVAKFSYYVDTYFPQLFSFNQRKSISEQHSSKQQNKLHSKTTNRNINYNYFYSKCDFTATINSNSILGSVKKLYLNQDVIKINEMSYSKQTLIKQQYLPVYGTVKEIIDFVLIEDKQQKLKPEPQKRSSITTKNKPQNYWLYVIHNSNSFQPSDSHHDHNLSWQHFIERYHFTIQPMNGNIQSQVPNTIEYQLAYSYKQVSSYLGFEEQLTKKFIESHCKLLSGNSLENLQKLQGYLLQRSSDVKSTLAREKDIAFSDEHKRQTKIPVEYFKHYLKLKNEIYQYYIQLHQLPSVDQINKYFYENLVCRYLVAKQYQFQEAKKSIIEYLIWQKQMREKYPSIDCFKQYHQLGAYQCIGEDFMGRPVLLSKSALIDVNKLPDIEKYCDYYIYFLEIHLREKMRGYVDQMLVIGDLTDLGTRNFKLAITKRNVGDSLKYGPERQHALIIVHASTFAYTAWTFIKPLLPKKTLHKIQISGHNKKQIVQALSSRMDIKVIPEYLGGQNTNVDKQFTITKSPQKESNNAEEQIEFVQSKKSNSAMAKLQRVSNNNQQNFQSVEMVTSQSAITEPKKSQNFLFSLFQTVTKSLGLNFDD